MKYSSLSRLFSALVSAVVFSQVYSLPGIARETPPSPSRSKEATSASQQTFFEALEKVRNYYYDAKIKDAQIFEGAIKGLLNHLDPHSDYLNQEEFEGLTEHTKGEFGGLGIEITQEHGVIKIVSPMDDTPAYEAGLKAGDYIVWIDDQPVVGMSVQEAVEKMRGEKGTKVKLRIVREGTDPFDVTLTRASIKMIPVKSRLEGEVGYVRISTFNEHTTEMVKTAVERIKKDLNDKLKGIVLDLRNNPGGILDQAVSVADLFLEEGEIVSVHPRDPNRIERRNATKGDIAQGIPLAVLINSGSASASEIVAGALRDHRRAVLVGTRSFGKGSVQVVSPLGNKQGAIKLTVALYCLPSGKSIQGEGVSPDLLVYPAKVEFIEDKRRREENLQGALKPANGAPSLLEKEKTLQKPASDKPALPDQNKPLPEKEKKAEEVKIPDSENDYQLTRAIDLLKAYSIFQKQGFEFNKERSQKGFFSILTR